MLKIEVEVVSSVEVVMEFFQGAIFVWPHCTNTSSTYITHSLGLYGKANGAHFSTSSMKRLATRLVDDECLCAFFLLLQI